MLNTIKKYIQEHNLCTTNNKVLLGVSGGIDSICMLHILNKLNYNIAIAHCNFQLRGEESNGDEQFVIKIASKLNIPIYHKRFNTKEFAEENNISIQMAARELRFKWFNQITIKEKFDFVAIAHNRDDVIETFFNNLSRGTGIKGLTGIKPKTANIIRPLLNVSRNNIESYVKTNNISYREDSTNKTTKYARNLIRHKIIPLFEELNPSFRTTMIDNISRFYETENIYSESIKESIKDIKHIENDKIFINIEKLKATNTISALLYEMLKEYNFSSSQLKDIEESLCNNSSGKRFLSCTHRLIKDRSKLIISTVKNNLSDSFIINSLTDFARCPLNIIGVKEKITTSLKLKNTSNIGLFDADKVSFPLTLRKWQHGDMFYPLGMNKKKKLSDFFIDIKLSLIEKENVWILESNKKIMWIVGIRIDDRFKITSDSKSFLQLTTNNL